MKNRTKTRLFIKRLQKRFLAGVEKIIAGEKSISIGNAQRLMFIVINHQEKQAELKIKRYGSKDIGVKEKDFEVYYPDDYY